MRVRITVAALRFRLFLLAVGVVLGALYILGLFTPQTSCERDTRLHRYG